MISVNLMKNNQEAFVYMWFDGNNRKFYIGMHRGSPSGTYTHSSTQMTSFGMTNIPSGFHRRILATGSYEDMMHLEVKLLCNRLVPVNDKYHNIIIGAQINQRSGIKRARERGVKFGRRASLTDRQIAEMTMKYNSGVSVPALMTEYPISRASIYRLIK